MMNQILVPVVVRVVEVVTPVVDVVVPTVVDVVGAEELDVMVDDITVDGTVLDVVTENTKIAISEMAMSFLTCSRT